MVTAVDPPRYLTYFQRKRISHRYTDVLVLGTGLAGLRAALAVDPSRHVLVVTKEGVRQSNSNYAQGGIAAVWSPSDTFQDHTNDTIDAGKGLCDLAVVNLVIREAPARVRELIEWGAIFDKHNGEIALTLEGGHSFHRVLHALGDATGKEVIRAILEKTKSQPNIQITENTFILDLLTVNDRCVGALTWSQAGGVQAVWSKQTILATGGCGQVYRETTNPTVATGDGMAMAYRAGAQLQDMEFMQFHPTVLYVAGGARQLISEAVRGEGAYLRDRLGERFMSDYDPRAELAPRDVVARAMVSQMNKTQHPCVYLDLSHLNATEMRNRFPGLTAACARYGLDFARDPIPVRPGAHYMVGGISTDLHGRTTLDGLWACGEVAATGLHGANRLASNSLLEALVFGQLCGRGADAAAAAVPDDYHALPIEEKAARVHRPELDIADIRNSLTSLMFRHVGIERSSEGLINARETVDFWCQYVLDSEFTQPAGWELQNMLTVAGLIIRAAIERTESRGTHSRDDYPLTDDRQWQCHLTMRGRPFRFGRKEFADSGSSVDAVAAR